MSDLFATVEAPVWAICLMLGLNAAIIIMTWWFDRWSHKRVDEAKRYYAESQAMWRDVDAMLDRYDATQTDK